MIEKGEGRGVRPRMKRKEPSLGGCVGDIFVPEKSTKGERSSKRCSVRSRVSSEDNMSSGIRVEEDEVRSPWFLRYVVTSEEEYVQSSNTDVVEDGNGPL
jgi:hypothetical protein